MKSSPGGQMTLSNLVVHSSLWTHVDGRRLEAVRTVDPGALKVKVPSMSNNSC